MEFIIKSLLPIIILVATIVVSIPFVKKPIDKHKVNDLSSLSPNAGITNTLTDFDSIPEKEVSLVIKKEEIPIATSCYQDTYSTGYASTTINVRKEPYETAEIVRQIMINTEITYKQFNDEWAQIEDGYIYEPYISDVLIMHECEKTLEPSEFKRKGEVKYGSYRYTWYSQRVLPGGGLKIPGRHVDEDGFVCDENGYICLASGMHKKGTVLDTPVGRQGIVYDYCETDNTIDIYVNW